MPFSIFGLLLHGLRSVSEMYFGVFKSVLSKFFKGYLPQNLLSPLLNTLSQLTFKICWSSHDNPFYFKYV